MKIILKEDIVNLGFKNDVVEVKNGYGRNYLIPAGKAILATPSALKIHAENLRRIRVEQVRQVQPEGFSADGHLHNLPEGVPGEAGLRRTVVRFGDLQGRGPGGDPVARLRESGGQARREGEHEQESFHRWGGLLGKRLGLTMIGSPASSCCGMPSRSDWMLRKRSESMGVLSGSTPSGNGRPEKVWK